MKTDGLAPLLGVTVAAGAYTAWLSDYGGGSLFDFVVGFAGVCLFFFFFYVVGWVAGEIIDKGESKVKRRLLSAVCVAVVVLVAWTSANGRAEERAQREAEERKEAYQEAYNAGLYSQEAENRIDSSIEDLYSELANDIEDARLGLLDADEMLRYLEDVNGSYDARQIADGPYRQAVDALSDLYMKYVG